MTPLPRPMHRKVCAGNKTPNIDYYPPSAEDWTIIWPDGDTFRARDPLLRSFYFVLPVGDLTHACKSLRAQRHLSALLILVSLARDRRATYVVSEDEILPEIFEYHSLLVLKSPMIYVGDI